jgi:hypothetical protein
MDFHNEVPWVSQVLGPRAQYCDDQIVSSRIRVILTNVSKYAINSEQSERQDSESDDVQDKHTLHTVHFLAETHPIILVHTSTRTDHFESQ